MSEVRFKIFYNYNFEDNIHSKFITRNKNLKIPNCEIFCDKNQWDNINSVINKLTNKKNGNICNNMIPESFFKKEYLDSDTSIIFVLESKKSSNIIGFSLCNDLNLESNYNGIYLDAICCKPGYGSILLKFIENFAQKKKFNFIELSALAYIINYYRKQGYRHTKNCRLKEGEGYREKNIPKLAELNVIKKFKNEDDIIYWKEGKNKNIILKSINEKDPDFVNFLKLLSIRGYGVSCSKYKKRPKDNKTYTFIKKKCMNEGFTMRKCFKKSKSKRKRKTKKNQKG